MQKKYLHTRKCRGIPRHASQKWMNVETTVTELGRSLQPVVVQQAVEEVSRREVAAALEEGR
jgi:hypothetical protein